MNSQSYYLEEGFPFHHRKLEKLKAFLAKNDLTYDQQIQYSVLLCNDEGGIVGCGSRHENILKCIAIDKTLQGEGLLQRIMTQLITNAFDQGMSHLFLFTKPQYNEIFSDMGFYPITETKDMLLMENRRNGIQQYLAKEAAPFKGLSDTMVGAIVMNANPFTNGHRYLVETAARQCDRLHVFVLSADASEFPPDVRLELVKRGCSDFPNVFIHGSSDYLISHATFPDYFLKDKASGSEKAVELDLKIFGNYYQKAFGITHRFVGEEPFSKITALYNQEMKKILPHYGIQVVELPRHCLDDTIISATFVRKKFLEGDLQGLKTFVPSATYEYLLSKKGQRLRDKLLEKGETL